MLINKRYKDIFERYIHRGEPTPLTIGTLVVCALCFLILIVATFTQVNFSHVWFDGPKEVAYSPIIPAMILIIYILGKYYSLLTFVLYLLTGFFIWPIFAYGGGLGSFQNYLFGYFLGFVLAILISGTILNINQKIKTRMLAALFGVVSIHICGLIYCIILALFKVIDFNLIFSIVNVISASKIIYDILFSLLVIFFAPYFKNILWVCMKPKADNKLKNTCKRNKIIRDNINKHRQYYN